MNQISERDKNNRLRYFLGDMSINLKMMINVSLLVLFVALALILVNFKNSESEIRENLETSINNTMNLTISSLEYEEDKIDSVFFNLSVDREFQGLLMEGGRLMEENSNDEYALYEIGSKIKTLFGAEQLDYQIMSRFYAYGPNGYVCGNRADKYEYPEDSINFDKIKEAAGKTVWFAPVEVSTQAGIVSSMKMIMVGKLIYDIERMEPIGYLIGYVRCSWLDNVIKDIYFSENDLLYLVDQNGEPLNEMNVPSDLNSLPFKENEVVSTWYSGENKYIAQYTDAKHHLGIVLVTDGIDKNTSLIYLRNLTIIVSLIAAVISVFGSMVISRSLSKPIMDLVKEMKRFKDGETQIQIPVKYNDEIGILRAGFNQFIQEVNQLIEKNRIEQELRMQARMKMLQTQINPHFLYNTLDTINWMALSYGAEDISKVTYALGDLMRFSLSSSEEISIEEEMDAVEKYFLIQRYRLGEALKTEFDLPEEILYEEIPPHTILPIVENAFKHGLKHKIGDKIIRISGEIIEDGYVVHIEDNGIGMEQEQLLEIENNLVNSSNASIDVDREEMSIGIGLVNVHQRLIMKYGVLSGLRIESTPNEGTKISIMIRSREADILSSNSGNDKDKPERSKKKKKYSSRNK